MLHVFPSKSVLHPSTPLCLQTYEGGLGAEPGNEAHGGYTFCGLATMMLIGKENELDLPALLRWATQVCWGGS